MKKLLLVFEESDFKKLENAKEEQKILGTIKSWEDYILHLAKIKKK